MRSVVFINRFYWPEQTATGQLLTDLAEVLAARGLGVTVISTFPNDGRRASPEQHNGVRIERVKTTRWGRRSLPGRCVDFITFYIAALWRLFRLVRRGDAVVAMTDPPLLGVFVWPVVRFCRARLYHWVQDIYPEIAVNVSGRRWPLGLRPFRDFTWRHSAGCVVPGTDMAAVVAAAGVDRKKITLSPNWAPAGLLPPSAAEVAAQREVWGLAGKFVALYSGNLGRVHNLLPLLDVAEALRDDPAFALVFVGSGAQRASLESSARERSLHNVRFLPPQPRAQLAAALGAGDVHFVTLRPGAENYVFPSKLYGIAQVGRPVIFVGQPSSEIGRLLQTHSFGLSFRASEIVPIATALRELQSCPARGLAMSSAARLFAAGGFSDAANGWHNLLAPELAAASRES